MSDSAIMHQLNRLNDHVWVITGTNPRCLVPTWFEATMPFLFENGLGREYKKVAG
jgi:hypothetical protein